MKPVNITVDGMSIEAEEGTSLLQAALSAGVYIPTLCSHPDLPSFEKAKPVSAVYQGTVRIEATSDEEYGGCQLCLVAVEGRGVVQACITAVSEGMVVTTNTSEIQEQRRENLAAILTNHPHECPFCPQHEGCDLQRCSMNVPENERCCPKFNTCELRKVAAYIGNPPGITRYRPQQHPVQEDEPLFRRDYNLCIGCTRCVRVCDDIIGAGALGYVIVDGKVEVGMQDIAADSSTCRYCGACVEVCPTGALMDRDIKWAEREAELVPCKNACPAGIDVPRYVSLVAEGKFTEASAVIRERVPFPAVLGRVCFHPCEDACRRNVLNDSIGIKELKCFAARYDSGIPETDMTPATVTGKQIAVIGSGPAGLTTGYYLARAGHKVKVFEAAPEPGGMLRLGIPAYRLPRDVLDREIAEIRKAGVEIDTDSTVDSIDKLFGEGFDAVFLATGAHMGVKLGIAGEDSAGVIDGVALLRNVALRQESSIGNRVAVVGGGNAAIDSARTALRLGAGDVTILYRRTRDEMPASAEEIEEAINEGINIEFLVTPNKISETNGALQVECQCMELGEPDESGRRRPVAVAGSEFTREFDNVITAIGQAPQIPPELGIDCDAKGQLFVNKETLETSRKGVFGGGDAVSGPASVIEAIAMGRRAAISIDRFLGGGGNIGGDSTGPALGDIHLEKAAGFARIRRVPAPVIPIADRKGNFKEIVLGYEQEGAVEEAGRCLRCDIRLRLAAVAPPPEKWLEFNAENIGAMPESEGICQLYDEEKKVIYIKGCMNLREELQMQLDEGAKACYFICEEERMFTQRENELLQNYLQEHGGLPSLNMGPDLDDLF